MMNAGDRDDQPPLTGDVDDDDPSSSVVLTGGVGLRPALKRSTTATTASPNKRPDIAQSPPKAGVRRSKNAGWRCASYRISNGLGAMFYRLGFAVASNPWRTIALSWLFVAVCALGMLRFHNEKNPLKLWIPQQSRFVSDTAWIMKHMEFGYRVQSVLITAPDVLQPAIMHKVALITEEVLRTRATAENGTSLLWSDVCFKIPMIAHLPELPRELPSTTTPAPSLFDALFGSSPKRRRPFNPSVDLSPLLYCPLIETLPIGCMSSNILDMWSNDAQHIRRLTRDDIIDTLNRTVRNPVTGHDQNFVHLLGDVRRNATGHIVGAGSLLTHWMVFVNFTEVDHDRTGNAAGTEDWASPEALAWEAEWLQRMPGLRRSLSRNGTQVWYAAARSFGDISSATMFQDMDKVFVGSLLMFVYMQAVLSRFGWTEVRLLFGGVGLMSVGMAYAAGVGLCSLAGVSYGPVHTSLPFLLMGLGVDDIFVMMSCWRQVQDMNTGCTLPERMGLMMRHAGSSITVTSITDVVAFLIGASTILPSLESFCIYAAVAVFIMYLLVITFVVAILTIDERRIEQKRNAFVPCIVHTDDERTQLCCQPRLMHRTLKALYTRVLFTVPGMAVVLCLTIASAAYSMQGLLRLEQRFDMDWFIPESAYLHGYLDAKRTFYPDNGHEATVFVGAVNYTLELPKLLRTVAEFEARPDLVRNVDAWTKPFRRFVDVYHDRDIASETLADDDWRQYLSEFLFSHEGGRYQQNFKFDRPLKCGRPTGNVTVSTVPFMHQRFAERNAYVPAMHEVERLVGQARLDSGTGFATVWGQVYGSWLTDEVIDTEVLRNILLALVCVMACTLVMIAEPLTCAYIFVCVLLTLVNVCGFMQRWGLTVDMVSCIGLELAVGLCVDYAAHVGHTFLHETVGSRRERALETVLHIGAAVLYGGGSTLLAVVMLAISEAYIFQAFFKIFLLVIGFGLFHGLVFLPVVLCLIGPEPLQSDAGDSGTAQPNADADEIVTFMPGKEESFPMRDTQTSSAFDDVEKAKL